jgi:hypothetical protein
MKQRRGEQEYNRKSKRLSKGRRRRGAGMCEGRM